MTADTRHNENLAAISKLANEVDDVKERLGVIENIMRDRPDRSRVFDRMERFLTEWYGEDGKDGLHRDIRRALIERRAAYIIVAIIVGVLAAAPGFVALTEHIHIK
jgi:hypothetical protein